MERSAETLPAVVPLVCLLLVRMVMLGLILGVQILGRVAAVEKGARRGSIPAATSPVVAVDTAATAATVAARQGYGVNLMHVPPAVSAAEDRFNAFVRWQLPGLSGE